MNRPLRGFAFPFHIDPRSGGVAATEGAGKLQENLKHLLLTRRGERVMLRDYGGGVTQLQHENINDVLLALARRQINKAILQYEPRVLIQEISILPRNPQTGELFVRVSYLQADQTDLQTIVLPLQ